MATESCPYCSAGVQRTDTTCPHCKRSLTAKALLENPPNEVREAAAIESGATPPRGAKYCQTCGTIARPKRHTKGSFIIEVFLWLMFIVPGLLYSLWRLTTKSWVCPKCGSSDIIPLDSPKARAALATAQ
jgi:hypothetical protein